MQEKLLHFIWQNLLFTTNELKSTDNETLQILSKGTLNAHAGPDFTNAKIMIGDIVWVGNVEIHIKSGDWKLHGHTKDPGYDNTILHVCWEYNEPIFRTDNSRISCLALKPVTDNTLLHRYAQLMESANDIPCSPRISSISPFTWSLWLERLVVERLEQKTAIIYEALEQTKYEWQEVFYRFIARNFGLKINTQPFENLARNLPLAILSKHKDSLKQIEALVFGVAGFLNDELIDEYGRNRQKEYRFLKKKYNLIEIDKTQWKFLRLMPANFPTVRLAQFASLIHHSNNLFSKLVSTPSIHSLCDLLSTSPSDYWKTHYLLDHLSTHREKRLGESTIQNIIINTVIPFKFAFGKHKHDESIQQNAFDLLEQVKPENNSIIKKWKDLGFKAENSLQSQALLQLKNEYCISKRCLDCNIGYKLLKNEAD